MITSTCYTALLIWNVCYSSKLHETAARSTLHSHFNPHLSVTMPFISNMFAFYIISVNKAMVYTSATNHSLFGMVFCDS